MKKRLGRWNVWFIAAAFFICAAVVTVAVINIVPAVSVMTGADGVPAAKPVLVLDAGHGGIDGGCSSANGDVEKNINLNIIKSLDCIATLYGYDTILTRETDKSIYDKGVTGIRNQKVSDMDNRLEIFNSNPGAVCVSVHQNMYTDPQFKGAQMFYSDSNEDNELLAQIMQEKFASTIQPYNEREIKLCGNELFLCYYCSNPTIMIECGFLSNPEEAALLVTPEYQSNVAFTIFSGLCDYDTAKG
ncbi:MAG: N-acetylmuramoyl-L-alanine amidase [Ruminococcus sp.]|jgi:N-acetylmuramoyl-L-alanine amidase|nr:N-acetylmuramoyl-L-alanine amidase [Ruminococcus sp.]